VYWSQLNVCIVFYTQLSETRVPSVRQRASPTQCVYCVLHAFERPQGTISEAEGLSQLNDCIVFYTQWSDNRVP
jgi:hypothetical protein